MPEVSLEDIKQIVERYGPIIPNDIRKRAGASDSTLVNVYLGQLVQNQTIQKTQLKLGSSPFYYAPSQREKLAELIEHLDNKDKRTAERLREQGVLRAADEEPLGRVSLKNIPDFAKPIQVKTSEGEEVFYRWYQLSPAEAKEHITTLLTPTPETPEPESHESTPKEPEQTETQPAEQPAQAPAQTREEPKREQQATLAQDIEAESDFAQRLVEYLTNKGITVTELDEVRKDGEIDCIIKLPTPVGPVTYFCKAKNKKNSNDGDLAQAILQAKKRMLPAMYITSGSVTQKAKDAPELGECTVIEWA